MDEGEEARCELVIAHGDAAELLELEEEGLHKMAFLVQPPIDRPWIVEMEAAIAAMETAAADAGQSVPDEVLAAKAALEEVKAAATDTSNQPPKG